MPAQPQPQNEDQLVVEHQFLLDDILKAQRRASGAKALETKNEFANEAYPLIHSLVEHFGERFERLESVVDELVNGTESLVQEDLAVQIQSTLELGRLLATAVMAIRGNVSPRDLAALQAQAQTFLTAQEIAAEALEEATIPSSGAGDGGDEDEDADEDAADDAADDDEDAAAAAANDEDTAVEGEE